MSRRDPRNARRVVSGLERLEGRNLLTGILVEGSPAGRVPEIRVLDADTGAERLRFRPFPSGRAGVKVAMGDVDGDGVLDIVAANGNPSNPVVGLFRSTDGTKLGQFDLPRELTGKGISVATGDVNGDGLADIVLAAGSGRAVVRVYSGPGGQLVGRFNADTVRSEPRWGGARVAVGDVNGDGFADIAASPVNGRSTVRVFSGDGFVPITSIQPFAGRSRGRNDVALADLNGDRRLEVVAAAPKGRTAVITTFNPTTGALLGRAEIAQAASAGGVRIAAINTGGLGYDELAVTPTRGPLGTVVITARALDAGLAKAAAVSYRLPAGTSGASYAGSSSVARATPAVAVSNLEPPLSQDLPVLERLAYFDPATQTFVPLQANDPRLAGKNITVLSHGWAPGYQAWVNHEAVDNKHVLKWWETFPGQPGFDAEWVKDNPQDPDSVFLLQGLTASSLFGTKTPISTTGLAQTISGRAQSGTTGPADPNAVFLAYSWIDDSATPDWDFLTEQIPEEAYRSEALTTLNGERLAEALQQAVGGSFAGQIQLVGHSHGSKVVSVASVAAQAAGLPIKQVTILDSPEDDVTVLGDAANYNWFFLNRLQGLDRSDASGVFVDNYASEFGIAYSNISLSNDANPSLGQIVDVDLSPDAISPINLGAKHSYAAAWYAGSGQAAVNFGQTVGQFWSPLLPANAGSASPVPGLPSYAEQNWSTFSTPADQQYVLNPMDGDAPSETITFKPLSTAPVSLTQTGTQVSSKPVKVTAPLSGQSGIAFDYQFTNAKPGDRLIILAGGDLAFVMDAALVGSGVAHATISLYSLPLESHSLTFVLTSSASNTTSAVTVSNFQTFSQPLFVTALDA